MGIIVRQSIQNTIISYLGVALGFVSTILLYPHILDPDQYGLTRLLISLTAVSTQFAHLGIKNAIIRYFPYFVDRDRSRDKLLFLTFVIPFLGFILFTVFFFLFHHTLIQYFSGRAELFADYNLYLLPLVFFILFFEVLNNYIRSLQDSVTGSFLNEVVIRLIIIILLATYYFEWINFPVFMIGFVSAYAVQPVYLIVYLYLKGELSISMSVTSIGLPLIKGMSIYGAFSLLGGFATILVGNIDILMLSAMKDLENTAVYAIAFYVGAVIAVPQRSIGKIANPILSGLLKEKKYKQIKTLYKRTSLNQVVAGSLLLVGIWANIHNLMDLLPPAYNGAQWVIIIIGLAKLFDMATGVNGSIILNSRYYQFDLYSNIFLVLLAVFTNYLLIPPYGITGAAIATAISIFLYNFTKYIFVWLKFSMQPFQWNTLWVLLLATGCLLLAFQIPYLYNFFIDLIVRSGIIASVFFAFILMFDFSSDTKKLILDSIKTIKAYLHSFNEQ